MNFRLDLEHGLEIFWIFTLFLGGCSSLNFKDISNPPMLSSHPFPELQKSLQEVENPSKFGQVMAIFVKNHFFHVLGARSKYASHSKTYLATMVPRPFSRLMGSLWKVPEGFRKIRDFCHLGCEKA